LTNPATQFDVLQGSFYDKIIAETPPGRKCATDFFEGGIL